MFTVNKPLALDSISPIFRKPQSKLKPEFYGFYPYGHLSLKIHNVEFDITVRRNLMSKFKMRPYNSVQMSIWCKVLTYCVPSGALMLKT